MYCVGRQNAIAAPNKHGLAFTTLWTATCNSVTLRRLQIVESAVHSVWDTLRITLLSDTAMPASVWASDGWNTETTTILAFSQQNHYIIQSLCNRHRPDLTADRHLLYSHCQQETSVQMNTYYKHTTPHITEVSNHNVYSITHIRTCAYTHTHTQYSTAHADSPPAEKWSHLRCSPPPS